MGNILRRLFGSRNDRYLASIQPLVEKINTFEDAFSAKTDDELRNCTVEFRSRFEAGETLDGLLPEAFAAVRESAKRSLGMRHYDVQMVGGIILHQGKIPEMKTGEGKTLVSTLASYLNAIPGKGVHVVTVNDYLASRDAAWMGVIFETLGMTCGAVTHGLSPAERQDAYNCDITYATNNELGFDYLRDNMALDASTLVQRELNFAIVDEVDSILIDEARTPLIISGPTEDKTVLYTSMDKLMPNFKRDVHFQLDEKQRTVTLNDAGMDLAEDLLRQGGLLEEGASLYDMQNVMLVHHLNQALRAHHLFQAEVHYIKHENQVVIIDEFTGRMMPGRRFGDGLHQAIEAKENVEIQNENQTLASITFQNFFRMYNKLAGMTGTADTEAEEFQTIYKLDVVIVPTNLPIARADEQDIIYRTKDGKFNALIADIKDCYARKQPVLVGTTSIEKSEELAGVLKKEGVPHNVLNARYHEQEAEIVAQAGRAGAVTIATNMAGRGTDIKLGGDIAGLLDGVEDAAEQEKIRAAHKEEKAAVLAAGGLKIIGTERHESRRIDNQLRGRSGRQGDPGASVFYISLQDDLMRLFARGLDGLMERLDMKDDEAISHRWVSGSIETAQRKIEGRNYDIRKNILKFDDVLNEQRKVFYETRREILLSSSIADIIEDYRLDALEDYGYGAMPAGSYAEQWDMKSLKEELLRLFNITPDLDAWLEEDVDQEDIMERLRKRVSEVYAEKRQRLGEEVMDRLEVNVVLQVMDMQWKDHLQRLDFLRQGIHLRGYAQKDPLNEYKKEAFGLFEELMNSIRDQSVFLLSRVEVQAMEEAEQKMGEGELDATPNENPYAGQNIRRNDPCPCGSGKKYKHCHGALN